MIQERNFPNRIFDDEQHNSKHEVLHGIAILQEYLDNNVSDDHSEITVTTRFNVKPSHLDQFEIVVSCIMKELENMKFSSLPLFIKPTTGDNHYTAIQRYANVEELKGSIQIFKEDQLHSLLLLQNSLLQEVPEYSIEQGCFPWIEIPDTPKKSPKIKDCTRLERDDDKTCQELDLPLMRASFIPLLGMTRLVAESYQRNNKKAGQKNIRCFPTCHQGKHVSSGFCGTSVKVEFEVTRQTRSPASSSANDQILSYCRFVVCAQGAHDDNASGPSVCVGGTLPIERIKGLVRTRLVTNAPWIEGISVDTTSCGNRIYGTFEYNGEKIAWHYGWMAPTRQTLPSGGVQHALEVLFFQLEGSRARCIHIMRSDGFSIHSSRRKYLQSEEGKGRELKRPRIVSHEQPPEIVPVLTSGNPRLHLTGNMNSEVTVAIPHRLMICDRAEENVVVPNQELLKSSNSGLPSLGEPFLRPFREKYKDQRYMRNDAMPICAVRTELRYLPSPSSFNDSRMQCVLASHLDHACNCNNRSS